MDSDMDKCYANIYGGLGNQLFQIAVAFAYAKKYNKKLLVDSSRWGGSQGTSPSVYMPTIFKNLIFESPDCEVHTIHEPHFHYFEIPFYKGSVYFDGYFQTLKYFENVKDEFKQTLELPVIDSNKISSDMVAMHIRRGDYLKFADIHYICNTKYFELFFESFLNKEVHVYTDSPEYVLNEFKSYDFKIINCDDLTALSMIGKYKNVICSNSSFSWWATFLGQCENIYVPDKWFGGACPHNYSDIYRDDMIKIKMDSLK